MLCIHTYRDGYIHLFHAKVFVCLFFTKKSIYMGNVCTLTGLTNSLAQLLMLLKVLI